LVDSKLLTAENYTIKIPTKSREIGDLKGQCYVSFKSIDDDTIALVRILLHDTRWCDDGSENRAPLLKCFWARAREIRERPEKVDKSDKVFKYVKAAKSESKQGAEGEVRVHDPATASMSGDEYRAYKAKMAKSSPKPKKSVK
jgi:hypothetical protein